MSAVDNNERYRFIDLKTGEAIRYWQLSDIAEQRFDVSPRPMEGDMDPFFFLSKKKNFIPHQYPCRTEFLQEFAGKHPTPLGDFNVRTWWYPFGSDRVDLSGFWFRPTRLGAWARTGIFAETAGKARFRLSTCGGAILHVNGEEVHWTALYQRNYENSTEFEIALKQGINEFCLYFDDLAERDIRYYFQLDYLDGVKTKVALPVPVTSDVAETIEAMLEGMSFEHAAYFEGDVCLVFGAPAPVDIAVNCKICGDFISLDDPLLVQAVLSKGETKLTIASADHIQADFRNVTVTLDVDGFNTSRRLGVEICHVKKQGTPPAKLADRVTEALNHVAEFGELSSVKALARLATGHAGEITDAMIARVLPSVLDCHDCADFTLVPLLWCRIRYGGRINPEVRNAVDEAILNFRYWMDEPGNDVQWYFSENHALLFHTAAYLAGSFFPNEVFIRSGRKGSDQALAGRQRIEAWLNHFEECEMAEWNSVPYFPIDLKGLTALAGLAEDASIRERAIKAIKRLITQIAKSSHHGLMTASQGRAYEHTLRAGRSLELSAFSRLFWGRGWYGCRFHALPQLALLVQEHALALPEALTSIADYQGDQGLEWCFSQGKDSIAKLYHYKTRNVAMGSIAAYRWSEWGYQESPIQLRLGDHPEAQIWINHPGETIQAGFGRPSFWGGCGTLPRVHQYRGLAVLEFNTHEGQPDFTHAWLPVESFDQVEIHGKTIGVRSGNGMAILIGSSDFIPVQSGPTAGCEVRLPGLKGIWIVRLCDDKQTGELKHFTDRFSSLNVQNDNGTLVINDPAYGQVRFSAEGVIEAESRFINPKTWPIEGISHDLPLI
ncbi:MAG: hypothetical protein P4L87_01330 [Formivibrio sp.]|nr:hypothetical protein [Formivibrio sp.]